MRVAYTGAQPVARITLTRPEKRNALDPEAIRQLRSAFDAVARDDTVRVVVLSSDGLDFSAGADIDSLAALADADAEAHRADARAFADLFRSMRALPKPIVAEVRGRALAGGAGLATACDIVVAANDAQFGYPEVRIGFVAAVVMSLLRRAVGEKAAFDVLATGRLVYADEAARMGLVSRVVATDQLSAAVDDLASELASLPPEAVARTKKLFYELDGLGLDDALDRGVDANVAARTTPAFRKGITEFLARRSR